MKLSFSKQDWYIILFFDMILWGTLAPATRYLSNMPQSLLALFRAGFAALVLIIYMLATKKDFHVDKKDILHLILVSLLAGYLPPLLYTIGIAKTSSIIGSLITNTSPLFITIFSVFMLKESFSLKRFLFIIAGFIGVIIIVSDSGKLSLSLSSAFFLGIILLIVNALVVALNTIFGKNLVKRYGGAKTTTYFMLIGFLALSLHNLLTGDIYKMNSLTQKDLWLSIYIGVFPTAITWILFLSSMKVLSPTEASIFKLLIPVFTVVFSIIFLKEALTPNLVLGGAVVISSIYFVQKSSKKVEPDLE